MSNLRVVASPPPIEIPTFFTCWDRLTKARQPLHSPKRRHGIVIVSYDTLLPPLKYWSHGPTLCLLFAAQIERDSPTPPK